MPPSLTRAVPLAGRVRGFGSITQPADGPNDDGTPQDGG